MNINNSNNNDDDDDEDEFAHLSFDPTTNDIDDNSDAVLELQMTMVALQTEHDILLQKIQQQNKQQVRLLQDEIRQLQNEINVLSTVAHTKSRPSTHNNNTVSSTRPLPPPGANLCARSNAILFPTTTTAPFEKEVSRISQPPQLASGETSDETSRCTIPDPPPVPHHHSPPRQSPYSTTDTSGARWWWMEHFLRQQQHYHDPIILQRLMVPIRSGSEWEVLHWFLVEIVTEQQQHHKTTITTYLQSLWKCFHEILSCCLPQSYRPIQMGLLESPPDDASNNNSNYSLTIESAINDPMRQLPRRRQRLKGLRTSSITAYRRSSDETTASPSDSALYTSVEQHLSHPLFVSSFSSSRPLPDAKNLHHSYDVQRFIQNGLYHWYDLGRLVLLQRQQISDQRSTDHMTNEEDNNKDTSGSGDGTISQLSSISILAMQITGLLVSNSRETIRPPSPPSASNDQSFCFPDNCCDSLLNNILNIGQSIVRYPPRSQIKNIGAHNRGDHTKHQRNRHHHTKHATHLSSSHVVLPPFRLVHVEYMEQQQQQQLERLPGDRPEVYPVDKTLFAHFDERNALSWMAEALNLLQILIWTKPNHSSLSPRELVWIKTKRTAALMGILLDVLEYTILPNISLYTHPFTITCVRWIQGLIERPLVQLPTSSVTISTIIDLGFYDDDTDVVKNNSSTSSSSHGSNNYTTNSNYYYWRLVRTQNVTTDSTAELWHTSPTAINLLLQIFTRIVLQQMSHDHIPSEAVDVIPLLPLRDAIIRFMHSILLQVQKDRQLWEQQHYRMKQGPATASASNKVATKKRMRPILSFIIILSDQMEIYKSMITVLLSSNNPASVANCDNGITNSLYCLHDDLYTMLQLQLEEITDDQYEKLQHG